MRIGRLCFCIALAFLATLARGEGATDQTLERQEKALHAIDEFAHEICNDISTSGTQQNITLDANGQAQLSRLLKFVGDLGFNGGAKYSLSDYKGLVQADVGKALHDAQECRIDVLNSLKDKMLASPSGSSDAGHTSRHGVPTQLVWRQPSESPNSFAAHWLTYLDNQEWDKAYAELGQEAKDSYSASEFAQLLYSQRSPRGRVLTRKFVGAQPADRKATAPPDVKGIAVLYNTTFEHSSSVTAEPGEVVLLLLSPQGKYRVAAYNCQTCGGS
ncbi:DUF4019 domain-containing protein [Paraburkholderia fynbosensis]|uniref:Bacterial CdiA-CT RNAse A domain-containing protein n=1 Tax=Paraburkholderia fynbosensis TaxID=1200993 RepID=A0A6J5FIV8_9BURK|nr:DUF4019 domain-containing protein [Paraburkholderia fynbosensis]CAB3780729.1 hypothetical protein LMG27177_00988 [Paraburkholderia fynbosensis]